MGDGSLLLALLPRLGIPSLGSCKAIHSILEFAHYWAVGLYYRSEYGCCGQYMRPNFGIVGVEASARSRCSLRSDLCCVIRCRPARTPNEDTSTESNSNAHPRTWMHTCVHPSSRQRMGSGSARPPPSSIVRRRYLWMDGMSPLYGKLCNCIIVDIR